MMESTLVPNNNNTTTDNPLFGDDDNDNDQHGHHRNDNPLFRSLEDAVEDIDIATNTAAPSQSMTTAAAIASSAYNNGVNTSSPAPLAPAVVATTTTSTTKTSRVNDLMGQLLLGDNDINGNNGSGDDIAQEIITAEEVEDPLFAPMFMSPSERAPTTTTTTTSSTTSNLHPSLSQKTTSTTASMMSLTTAPPVALSTTKLLAESGLLDAVVPSSSSMPSSSSNGGGGGGGKEGRATALFEDDNVGTTGGACDSLFHDDDVISGNNTGLFDEVDATTEQQYHPTTTDEGNTQQEGNTANGTDGGGGQQYGGYDFGMGMMGVGGEIPKSPHPPSNYQYSQYHPTGPHQQQQQQQQQHQQYQHQYPNYSTPSHPQQQQHHQNQVGGVMNAMAGSYYYSTTGAGQMTQRGAPTLTIATSSSSPMMSPQPSILAGMHVGHDVNLGGVAPLPPTATNASTFSDRHHRLDGDLPMPNYYIPPEPFEPHYGKVVVGDPMLIQGSGLFAGPPHWTYLVTVYAKNAGNNTNIQQQQQQQQHQQSQPISAVRRRFRHFVALEDRLRQSVPGAILPPRPDKHPTRAIEEASGRQSMDFARQRASELSVYMNALVQHPYAGPSPDLRLFLMLQDHIGTAWPEVSPSALTRIAAAGSATVERLADVVDGALGELGAAQQVAAGEDSAEILALAAREGRRIGAVSSSVPKVEGAVALICDRGDKLGSTGMELSKLVKDVTWCDRDLTGPLEILAGAMLRSGRRTRRLGLEVGDAITPFVVQYRMCKYEQMAFADRRLALRRRTEARTRADQRAAKLMMNQTSMQSYGRLGTLERMETEAAMYDELAMEASKEADEVAIRLQAEVGRIGTIRVEEWEKSMRVTASGMREGYAENASIWESALEAFRREFPDIS